MSYVLFRIILNKREKQELRARNQGFGNVGRLVGCHAELVEAWWAGSLRTSFDRLRVTVPPF